MLEDLAKQDKAKIAKVAETLPKPVTKRKSVTDQMAEAVPTRARMSINMSNMELTSIDANELLSYTDRCLIHIARAFVMNPEMIVVHKPLGHFDSRQEVVMVEALREYVNNRGVQKPEYDHDKRRPRTCIYSMDHTSKWLNTPLAADIRYYVGDGRIERFDSDEVAAFTKYCLNAVKTLD